MKLSWWPIVLGSVVLHAMAFWLVPGFATRELASVATIQVVLSPSSTQNTISPHQAAPEPLPRARAKVNKPAPAQQNTAVKAASPKAAAQPKVMTQAVKPEIVPLKVDAPNPASVSTPPNLNPSKVTTADATAADAGKANEAAKAGAAIKVANFNAAYLRNPQPEMPLISRQRGESGRVVLRVLVSAQGKPKNVEIAKSSGFAALDRAARNTVAEQWRFEAATRGDQPIEDEVLVPISFRLTD